MLHTGIEDSTTGEAVLSKIIEVNSCFKCPHIAKHYPFSTRGVYFTCEKSGSRVIKGDIKKIQSWCRLKDKEGIGGKDKGNE